MRRFRIVVSSLALTLLAACAAGRYDLVEIRKLDPTLQVDLKYATADNFLHRPLYSDSRCFLRRCTAERLIRAHRQLQSQGYGIKIWDGYRPLSVQKAMWKIMPDANFVADPAKGSRHNRGAAVDVTLVDGSGREVEMPTPFDDFTPRAAARSADVTPEAARHRQLLQEAMTGAGFILYEAEWWHFNDPEWEKCEILDVDSKNL